MTTDFGDRELQELRAALNELADGATDDCAAAERIWAASRGRLDADETNRLLEHSTGCAACAEAWRLAREFAFASGEKGERRTFPATRWGLLAAAAMITLAAIVLPGLLREKPQPTFRETGRFAIESLLDVATVPRDPCELRWSAGPEGTLYTLEVADEQLDVIHRARGLERTSAVVPVEALAGIADGATIVWRVEARLPDGVTVRSMTFVATLEETGEGGDAP